MVYETEAKVISPSVEIKRESDMSARMYASSDKNSKVKEQTNDAITQKGLEELFFLLKRMLQYNGRFLFGTSLDAKLYIGPNDDKIERPYEKNKQDDAPYLYVDKSTEDMNVPYKTVTMFENKGEKDEKSTKYELVKPEEKELVKLFTGEVVETRVPHRLVEENKKLVSSSKNPKTILLRSVSNPRYFALTTATSKKGDVLLVNYNKVEKKNIKDEHFELLIKSSFAVLTEDRVNYEKDKRFRRKDITFNDGLEEYEFFLL